MTISSNIKRMLTGIILLLATVIMLTIIPIHAMSGLPTGNAVDKNDPLNRGNAGGPTYSRTAWILNLVDENGQSTLGSQVMFFPYANNTTFGECNGSITTEFFENPATGVVWDTYINTIPAFDGSVGGGSILKAWLMQPCDDPNYSSNAGYVAEQYLHVPREEINKELANGKTIYLQFTPIFWARLQKENKDSQMGWWISNSRLWAIANPKPSFIASATHRNFPQCCALEFPWWGLGSVSGFKGPGEYWELSEWQANGLGIGGVSLKSGYQIVLCIETGTGWNTQYLTTDRYYEIKNNIGGAVLQSDSGFVSQTPTKSTSSSATYSEVKNGCTQIGSLVSGGTYDFLSRPNSKALFLHYKGQVQVSATAATDLYAWEVSYRLPGCKAGITTSKRTDKGILHNSFNSMQSLVNSWQNSQLGGTSDVLEKRELDRSQPTDHDYRLTQNHGAFHIDGGIWQLYRSPYNDLWEEYPSLEGRVWTVQDKIDTNYGYYLTRSHLESLGIVEDRENAGLAGKYLAKTKAFVVGYNGKTGADQGANTIKTHTGKAPYSWSYTAHWTGEGAWIEYEYRTRERLPHSDKFGCFGDNPDTPLVQEDDYLLCSSRHYTPWSPWKKTKPSRAASAFYSRGGSYGGHNISKYKSQITATGKSGHAGEESIATEGIDLKGKFVKGSDFDFTSSRISKAIHGSEFNMTYKLYGEIPFLFWIQGNTYTYDTQTAETVFIWSEYERSIKPSMVHGFKTEIDTGVMNGVGSIATAATGHTAQTVKSQSSATTLGLTYMGTTFNLGTTSRYKFEFNTLGFTTEDERSEGINANSAWGNEHSPVKAAHETYVNSVLAGVRQEIIMELTFKPSGKKLYYELLTDENGVTGKVTDKIGDYDLWWKNNSLNGSIDYSGFYNSGTAESYLNVRELYDGTLINNGETHEGQENNSEPSEIKDAVDYSVGSYGEYTNYGSWYDEESFYRFEVEKYRTTVTMDHLGASDKIDYNVLTQSVLSNYLNQKDFIEVRFYTRLYREPNTKFTDGYYSWNGCDTFRVDKIQNVDFTVINQSTEDIKK